MIMSFKKEKINPSQIENHKKLRKLQIENYKKLSKLKLSYVQNKNLPDDQYPQRQGLYHQCEVEEKISAEKLINLLGQDE